MTGLDDAERLARLRLIRSENVGPITFHHLLRHFHSAQTAIEALPSLSRKGGRRQEIRVCGRVDAEEELARLAQRHVDLLIFGDPEYPHILANIEDAPPVLHVIGRLDLLTRPAVAVVGARNASLNGRKLAERLACELGAADLVIVSGLARGIDAAAHRGSLATGSVAVLGGGADIVYPAENRAIYERLAAEGTILSEFPLGTEPQARHFPRRNRIIAGLSLGVVVVEAARRSGSLITARLALEHGREIFAVPGSPLDERCRGTNRLIRDGAVLTECAQDVIDTLSPMTQTQTRPPPIASEAPIERFEIGDDDRQDIMECLSPSPVPVDEIVRQCDLPASVVQRILLEQELAGHIQRQPGGLVATV